jgi:peptide/nickel transport system substrate-binding protein
MRKLMIGMALALCLLPALGGSAAKAASGGTLVWGRGGDSVSLDLAQATDGESIKAGIQVLENLVIFGKDSMNVEPQLAESWKVSDDGLTWTFKLRKGVKFHDGYPFNARAVYDSFGRVIFKQHPYHGYGKWQYLNLSLGMVKDIQVIDDFTIALVTEKPFAPLLNNLALWLCPIVSPKAMAEYKDKIGMNPVGTGPFKFKSWTKDDQIVLERNNDYWGEKAKVDRIVLKSIPEPSARLMALQSGTVDIADDLDPDSITLVKKNPKLAVIERPSVNVGYLAFNTEKPRLKDPKVRQALSHAIDRDTLIKTIFAGLAIAAKNPFPPSIWAYNDAVKAYDYNPEKAKKMLAEAKFDFNTEIELWAMPVSRAYMPDPVKTAELIQAYFAAVGVKAKIVRHEWGAYLSKIGSGEHEMCMLGWLGGNADPDNFLYGLLSADSAKSPGAANIAFWKNAEFTDLCLRGQKTFNKAERTKLYLKAQEIFNAEAPWAPLVHTMNVRCYSKKLHDVPLRPNGLNSFQMVRKEK